MRELNKQDMIDLLYGCAVLGTGGGGPLADGLALLEEHFEKGKTLKLITLDELPDDEYVVTPYGCGAPSAKPDPRLAHLKHSETAPAVLAVYRPRRRRRDHQVWLRLLLQAHCQYGPGG